MLVAFDYWNDIAIALINWVIQISHWQLKIKEEEVSSQLPVFELESNKFINHYYSTEFDLSQNLTIYCLYRKQILVIDSNLISKIWIDKIFWYLYDLWKGKNYAPSKTIVYGELNTTNRDTHIISSENDVLKHWIITLSPQKRAWDLTYIQTISSFAIMDPECTINWAWGFALDPIEAKARAISEAIERISFHTTSQGKNSIFSDNITQINLLKNYGLKKSNSKYNQVMMPLLLENAESILVPDDLIFANVWYNNIDYVNSTSGMATHMTLQKAQFSAIHELIERDIFLNARLLQKGVRLIESTSLSDELISLQKNIESDKSIEIELFDISLDNPFPVVAVLLKNENKRYLWVATWDTVAETIRIALLNASHFAININIQEEKIISQMTQSEWVSNENFHYFTVNDTAKHFEWMYEAAPITFNDMEKREYLTSLESVLDYYFKKGIHVYSYEYENPLNAIYDRKTVRLLSDWLLPIWYGSEIPDFIRTNERLKSFQKEYWVDTINEIIHPLA